MTGRQWIARQAALPISYSPAQAEFCRPDGAKVILARQVDGSWQAHAAGDPVVDECIYATWDVAMESLRRSGYRVPDPVERPFVLRSHAIRALREHGYQPVFLGGARV